MTTSGADSGPPTPLFIAADVISLVWGPDQPGISEDARDQPNIRLLGGIKAKDAENSSERAWREIRKSLPKNITLGIAVKVLLEDFTQSMLALHTLIIHLRYFSMHLEPIGNVMVANVVEHVERVDQQTLVPGRCIGNRIDVGGIFGIISTFQAQCRIDAHAARIKGRSQFEIDETVVLNAIFTVVALCDK